MHDSSELHEALSTYLHRLESLQETLPPLMAMAYVIRRMANAKKNKFLEENGEFIEELDGNKSYKVKIEHQRLFGRLDKKVTRASTAFDILPSKFLVAFVSEYDAFLGNLVKELLKLRPELLDASERVLTFSELKQMGSVEAAYEYILEKEVETLLRKSHSEQFEWLEKKFDIPLRKGLSSWKTFIEITERRNLYVHCDGVVSTQYLTVCGKHGVSLGDDIKLGVRLDTSREYLTNAYRCLYELGFKLTHVLWRKLMPADLDSSDMSLINVTYNLIHEEDYELASNLLDFSTVTLKKWFSDSNRRILTVNRAQAYYHKGEESRTKEILGNEDWTSCGDNYQVCVAVLERDYDKAANLMRRIGKTGQISESDYIDWPVFRDFRESKQFSDTYVEIFGKEPVNVSNLVEEPQLDEVVKILEEDSKENEKGVSTLK